MSNQAQQVLRAAQRHNGPVDAYLTPDNRVVVVPADAVLVGRYTADAEPGWIEADLGAVLGVERAEKSTQPD